FTTPTLTAFGYPGHRSIAVASAGGFFISIVGAAGSAINGIGIHGRPQFSLGYIDLTAVLVMIAPVIIMAPQGVRRYDCSSNNNGASGCKACKSPEPGGAKESFFHFLLHGGPRYDEDSLLLERVLI
ncbi:MAG: hypothetical protein V3U19_02045, partial [Thermodesulfobacteriota bacterium]